MSQYLLSIYQPYGETMDQFPDAEFLEPIMREVTALKEDMRRQGVWVFDGGLHAPTTATVLRARDGQVLTTDGPFEIGRASCRERVQRSVVRGGPAMKTPRIRRTITVTDIAR